MSQNADRGIEVCGRTSSAADRTPTRGKVRTPVVVEVALAGALDGRRPPRHVHVLSVPVPCAFFSQFAGQSGHPKGFSR